MPPARLSPTFPSSVFSIASLRFRQAALDLPLEKIAQFFRKKRTAVKPLTRTGRHIDGNAGDGPEGEVVHGDGGSGAAAGGQAGGPRGVRTPGAAVAGYGVPFGLARAGRRGGGGRCRSGCAVQRLARPGAVSGRRQVFHVAVSHCLAAVRGSAAPSSARGAD